MYCYAWGKVEYNNDIVYLFTNTNRPNSKNNIRALIYFKCRALINWFAMKMHVKKYDKREGF